MQIFSDISKRNLRYLSAKQAIEDIKGFVDQVNKREGLNNPKWIAVGGSYSGMLILSPVTLNMNFIILARC